MGQACEWFHHTYRDDGNRQSLCLHRIGQDKNLKDSWEAEDVSRSSPEQSRVDWCQPGFQKNWEITEKVYNLLKNCEHVGV